MAVGIFFITDLLLKNNNGKFKQEGIRARVEDGKKFKEGFEFLKVIGEGSFSTVIKNKTIIMS